LQCLDRAAIAQEREGHTLTVDENDCMRQIMISDIPLVVIATPTMLSGVKISPKNHAEIEIVVTSFAIPAIDIGTTPTR
jgi:hypothetical protein